MGIVSDYLRDVLADVSKQQASAYAQQAAQVDQAQVRCVAASIMFARIHMLLAAAVPQCLKAQPPVLVDCVGDGPALVFRHPGRAAVCRAQIQDAAVVVTYCIETVTGLETVGQHAFSAPVSLDETTVMHAANLVAIAVIDYVIRGVLSVG